ncbi:Intraflagellar transport protein 81 [Phytophthora nicotianae]|nr:Intraflagellar transport protein 81 [Phytophthora nicotianae]
MKIQSRELCTLKGIECWHQHRAFYEHENHLANVGSPKERVFTLAMKTQSRTIITDGVKLARIRNSLIDQFSMDRSTVPELKTIQNFVYNYKRSTLINTDFVDDVISLAMESRYCPELDDLTPFSFGYKLDNDGNPVLGDGNDEDPFILAFSTKYMLRQLDRSPGEFVFHMDASFKLTTK